MIFKWLLKKYYKHSPICNCGWTMKPFEEYTNRYQWKCIWEKCGWETYEGTSGKLHWYKKIKINEKKA